MRIFFTTIKPSSTTAQSLGRDGTVQSCICSRAAATSKMGSQPVDSAFISNVDVAPRNLSHAEAAPSSHVSI